MLKILFLELKRHRAVLKRTWFQQDCATAHTIILVSQWLKKNWWLSHCAACWVLVATSEPQPNSMCFLFLWGLLKAKVFSTFVLYLLMLKSRLRAKIAKIWKEMLQKLYENALLCFLHLYWKWWSSPPECYFQIKFISRKMANCSPFLYAFISFIFQGWIRYLSFCSGRTPGGTGENYQVFEISNHSSYSSM